MHPFADMIGFDITVREKGKSQLDLAVRNDLFNPNKVVHGGVLYALADTGMGAALFPTLNTGEICATINCAISYFRPVTQGTITCYSKVTNKGRSVATLDSEIWNEDKLVATAHGQFSIVPPRVSP